MHSVDIDLLEPITPLIGMGIILVISSALHNWQMSLDISSISIVLL